MIKTKFSPEIPDIIAEIETLSADLKDKAVRSGLIASAKPLKDALKQNVPIRHGAVQRSIGQSTLSKTAKSRMGYNADTRAILVGPVRRVNATIDGVTKRRSMGALANWLESGTAAHVIRARSKNKLLRFFAGGKSLYLARVNHPGARATHFMRNALLQSREKINEKFYQGLANFLNRKHKAEAKAEQK